MTTKEVFAAAADVLERDGWCQGSMYRADEDGRIIGRCLLGAVRQAAKTYDDYVFAGDLLVDLLDRAPSTWNDTPGRTADEVIAKLREFAS